MKVGQYCRECLADLARRVVELSGGNKKILHAALGLIDTSFHPDRSPTSISNAMLKEISRTSGVRDPFADLKKIELERAATASARLGDVFPKTLEGALHSSVFGNGGDFFVEHDYDLEHCEFHCDMDKIAAQVYVSRKILILGDNPGDFVFDAPLVALLKEMGKEVFYAIKERPIQNDMALSDLGSLDPSSISGNVISTRTDEVGIRREEMTGIVKECWDDGSCVIAKGMGNFESISEYDRERPVIYLMSVKCRTVAEAVGYRVGDYIGIVGGEHG